MYGLLAAALLLALVLLLVPKQRIAATNNITTGAFAVQKFGPKQGELCLSNQFVPKTTSDLRLLIGTYGSKDTVLRARILDGDEVVSRGSVKIVNEHELTRVPVSSLERSLPDARVCFAASAPIAIAGNPDGGPPAGQFTLDGKPRGEVIHVDYMHEGKQSLLQLLPTIFARASLWAPGWVGPWTFWLFMLLLPAVAFFACRRLVRLLRGDEPAGGRTWLWLAIGVALINAFAWTVFSPQLMAPDEVGHYAYTETLVQNHDVPSRTPGVGGYGSYGNHEALAVDMAIRGVLGNVDAKMAWNKGYYEAWRDQDAALPDLGKHQGGSWTSASNYSPLYYAGSAVPYVLTRGSTVWTRSWAMRLWSVLLTLLTVFFCFLFARELLPGVSWAGPVAAMAAAFEPMLLHIGSVVNNDAALIMFCSALMYVLARILRRGLTWPTAAAAGSFFALGLLAKPTMMAFVPAVAFVFGFAIVSGRGEKSIGGMPKRLLAGIGAGALAVLLLLPYYLTLGSGDSTTASAGGFSGEGSSPTRLLSYLWQWYFPQLPGMDFVTGTEGLPVLAVFVRGFIANFNSLDTFFPDIAYLPVTVVLLALLGGLAAWGWRERARALEWWPQALTCVLATGALMFLINMRSWQQILFDGQPFAQGRYLLPLIAIFGAGIVAGAQGFKRWAPALAAFAVTLLAVMNLFGYAASLTRFFV